MDCYHIIGLRVKHRTTGAAKLQEMLTKFGCHIKLRVGLHETGEGFCSDDGVSLLQVCGEPETIREMLDAFDKLDGVKAKLMELD